MCRTIAFLLHVIAVIHLTNGRCWIPEFTKCVEGDFQCYMRSTPQVAPLFLNGCPELGIAKFAPLYLPSLNASTPHLKFSLGNLTIYGIETCKPLNMGRTPEGRLFNQLVCDLKLEGSVDVEGKLLGVHTQGMGTIKLAYNQIKLEGSALILRFAGADNRYHLKFTDYDVNYELLGEPELLIEDQLQGNSELLHGNLAAFLRLHPTREIVAGFTKPLITELVTFMADNVNNFFAYLSVEDLMLPRLKLNN